MSFLYDFSALMLVILFGCLGFFTSPVSSQECNQADQADVVVLLDGSGSVGTVGFNKALEFVNRLVDAFDIGPSATQFALVVFTLRIESQFNWNSYATATELKEAISNTRFPYGGEDIAAAIHHARSMFQDESTGRRLNATWITILMTDGRSSSIQPSIEAAQQLKDLGVTIYTAGVGYNVRVEELQGVASNLSYYFHTLNYDALESISGPITSSACSDLSGCICYNGGTCTPGNLGNKCLCTAIFTGFYCDTPICNASPCFHGTCGVTGDSWYCTCDPGYTGTICDSDIDECASNPCDHGTCIDAVNGFRCNCHPGFTGVHCEEDIDECKSGPCQNEGSCIDYINSFACICVPGYTGITCELDIDECESSPCENGGTCRDWVNAFSCDCPPRYYGVYCETGICQPSVADIVFVLDSSASQTKEEFEKQLDFINHFIDHIVIGEHNLQVGVVTYSFKAVTEISLGEFNDNVTLKEAVRNIKYRRGATFTDKGLAEAERVFKNAPSQRPYGHTAKRFAFVLTDGLSTNRNATTNAAKSLRSTVNKVLAVGIGKEVSHLELLSIASSEDTVTGRKYVYSVQNFNALYTVVKELVRLTCEECSWKTSADVLFLLDMSINVPMDDFQTGLNAISYIVDKTSRFETENNTVRVGLITYGLGIQLQRSFDDPKTKQNFLGSIQKLVLPEGHCPAADPHCDIALMSDALKVAKRDVFDKTTNLTIETRQMVVILSNGQRPVTGETVADIDELRNGGKDIYVVALGPNADIKNLQRISGDSALVFSVYDELSTRSLDALLPEFFFNSCDLSNDFLND